MFRITFLALSLVVLVAPVTAQLVPGDYVAPVATTVGNTLLGITPGGTVKTIFKLPFPVTAELSSFTVLPLLASSMDSSSFARLSSGIIRDEKYWPFTLLKE